MTSTQHQAVWALCRQGLPLIADTAAEHWEQGQGFKLDKRVQVGRDLKTLIEQSNWEAFLLAEEPRLELA